MSNDSVMFRVSTVEDVDQWLRLWITDQKVERSTPSTALKQGPQHLLLQTQRKNFTALDYLLYNIPKRLQI